MNPGRGIFSFCRPISKCLPVSSKYSYATCLAEEKSSSKEINQLLIWSYDSGMLRTPCFATVTTVTDWHPKTEGSIHTINLKTNTEANRLHLGTVRTEIYFVPDTYHDGSRGYASNLYFEVAWFEFWPEHQLMDWSVRAISQANAGREPQKSSHDRVLPYPFQFSIRFHIAIRRYIVWGLLTSSNKELLLYMIHESFILRKYLQVTPLLLYCLQTGTVKYR